MKERYSMVAKVMDYDRYVGTKEFSTYAESVGEARKNMTHQAMKWLNKNNHGGIKLYGDIKKG